ncbi:uncharacterized protein LOC131231208 isoform X2 [Magnolia sinica]|uniref:uncharacterized protein LOC131231208 isoform X2 n=1 Tax=Magnolia sinica TaxID=86752 RepID=UPI00265AD57A|nr:uncharacterized protein LOC131231208 isoform X2 [Magnolia sinica]
MAGSNRGEDFVSQEEEANSLGKKYGGLVPKKKPLISKQGADLGQKSRTVVEALRPKLQRTPHQQLPPRRPTCTSGRETLE